MTKKLIGKLGIPFTLEGCVLSFIEWGTVLMSTKQILVLNSDYQLNRSLLFNKKVWPKPSLQHRPEIQKTAVDAWYKNNKLLARKYGVGAFVPVILLLKPISLPDLIKAIEREWPDSIQTAIYDYKNSHPYNAELGKIPISEVEGYIKLLRLRREGKSNKKIAELLNMDYDSERYKYSKISKILKNIGFPSLKL